MYLVGYSKDVDNSQVVGKLPGSFGSAYSTNNDKNIQSAPFLWYNSLIFLAEMVNYPVVSNFCHIPADTIRRSSDSLILASCLKVDFDIFENWIV